MTTNQGINIKLITSHHRLHQNAHLQTGEQGFLHHLRRGQADVVPLLSLFLLLVVLDEHLSGFHLQHGTRHNIAKYQSTKHWRLRKGGRECVWVKWEYKNENENRNGKEKMITRKGMRMRTGMETRENGNKNRNENEPGNWENVNKNGNETENGNRRWEQEKFIRTWYHLSLTPFSPPSIPATNIIKALWSSTHTPLNFNWD